MASVDVLRSQQNEASQDDSSQGVQSASDQSASSPAVKSANGKSVNGLQIDSPFCPTDVSDPFDTVEWELRSAEIKDEAGGQLFRQDDCEIPSTWSQLATNVVVRKYF